jgi:DNA-binding transcriptional MocR family regulator
MKKYEIVMNYIMKSVQMGNLQIGDYLPPIRTMSQTLDVSNLTVNEAYCRLASMGILVSVERKGFLLSPEAEIPDACEHAFSPFDSTIIPEIQACHYQSCLRYKELIQLGSIQPPNDYFPSELLSKYLVKTIRDHPQEINAYKVATLGADMSRYVEKTIANYMFAVSGTVVSETEIICANGARGGLSSALRACTRPGDLVAVENPGYLGVYNQLKHFRLDPLAIQAAPPHGLDIDMLQQMLESGAKPSCIVVTPNFHNPTGALMPLESRKRLGRLCEQYGVIIIEDDVLGSLHFKKNLPTLKSIMPDDVIYINSFSKMLAPGYRVGWVAGGKHTSRIKTLQGFDSIALERANQEAVATYLKANKPNTYLAGLRQIYEANCDKMIGIINGSFPKGTIVFKPSGGQYLWVGMPESVSAAAIFFEALRHNILLAPGNLFSNRNNDYRNYLRFSYSMPITEKVSDALEFVGKLAANYCSRQTSAR